MNASAIGLLAVKVATAAARYRVSRDLNPRDLRAINLVIDDLSKEARIFRGEAAPSVNDETAYAFAGITLSAMARPAGRNLDLAGTAAGRLESRVGQLRQLEQKSLTDDAALVEIEELFLTASAMATEDVAQSGEELDKTSDR